MPRVSVCIPSYNHEKYVRAAIDSVLSQSFEDFEIVVTDDGSTDHTVAEIRASEDPRISLVELRENLGAGVAGAVSIRRSKGEYIAILGSDDVFLPGKLERQVRFLDEHPDIGAVFARPVFIGEDGEPLPGSAQRDRTLLSARNRPAHEWLRHFFFEGNALCHPSVLIRRKCFDVVGHYNPALQQLPDLDMWVRLLLHFEIHVIDEPYVGFRVRANRMNMSAPRPEVLVRDAWEWSRILDHYARMDEALLRKIFPEIPRLPEQHPRASIAARLARRLLEQMVNESDSASRAATLDDRIAADSRPVIWSVAELALKVGRPAHVLFALDAMYGALPEISDDRKYRRFTALTGTYDLFGVLARPGPGVGAGAGPIGT